MHVLEMLVHKQECWSIFCTFLYVFKLAHVVCFLDLSWKEISSIVGIPPTKVCQYSHIMADATPVMNKSFEKLLSNNFQVIIFERIAKSCFKVIILSKICQNVCFSIKKVIIFYFLYIHDLDILMIITIYYHYMNF